MAGRGNIANLRPFRPGQSGNPRGAAGLLPPEIRAERKKNQASLIRLVIAYFALSDEEAMKRIAHPEATQLEGAVQGLISRAKEGDVNAFKYLIELICGKIPESDHDEFTEEDIRILQRVKEVFREEKESEHGSAREGDPEGA